MHTIVGADHSDLIGTLQLVHCTLRNQQSIMANFCFSLDAPKLAGAQQISRVLKFACDTNRSSLRINLAINENNLSFVWIDCSVCQGELQGHRVPVAEEVRLSSCLHVT